MHAPHEDASVVGTDQSTIGVAIALMVSADAVGVVVGTAVGDEGCFSEGDEGGYAGVVAGGVAVIVVLEVSFCFYWGFLLLELTMFREGQVLLLIRAANFLDLTLYRWESGSLTYHTEK